MIMFGQRLRGELGSLLYAFSVILFLVTAIGLLRLKHWSFPLAVGLHAFGMISGLLTLLTRNNRQKMQEMFSEMLMAESSTSSLQLLQNPAFAVFTMLRGVPIVSLLSITANPFLRHRPVQNLPSDLTASRGQRTP
jgi:hypothetical protein